jgi:D-beta-D-heptose 7-phosphate kinase/D-beta-D-heptose 1-phosphate adenosyltransferase
VVLVRNDLWAVGGAANVARNLRAIGPLAEVAGLTGKDALGDRLQNLFAEQGILYDSGFRDPDVSTISKTRIIASRQQVCRVDRERPPEAYSIARAIHLNRVESALRHADMLLFSDYAKGTLSQMVVDKLCKIAREKNCFIGADPKPSHSIHFSDVDLLTPNAGEALTMAGMNPYLPVGSVDWSVVCKKIYGKHAPKNLVITLGSEGMLVARNGQLSKKISTVAREVFDVSGAGDTVIAALSIGLASGHDLEKSAQFANVAAGIVVGKLGTAVATPAEILNSFRQNGLPQ